MNLLNDIKTAVGVFKNARQARKAGAGVKVKYTAEMPMPKTAPSFLDTVEGCALSNCEQEIFKRVGVAFKKLDCNTKKRLAFAPKNGEFVERARFWQNIIHEVLPGKQGHEAMRVILTAYIRIKRM